MSRPAARALPGLTAALCAVLAASFALGVRLTDVAAHAQHQPAFTHALPFAVVDSSFAPPLRVQLALIAVGAVQSAVLLLLFRVLRARAVGRLERAVLIAAGVTMLAVALGAPAMSGFDAYAYAGYAKLGWPAAYAPPNGRFAPPFDVVNHVWGAPMVPCYYGPLWVAVSALVAGRWESLATALAALRALEALAFVAIAAMLARRRRDAAFVALFALNPAIYALYVTNAHNDLFAVAFVFAATALARRFPGAAACAVAAAALIKITFVAAAPYVFAARLGARSRARWAVLAVSLGIGLSLLFGGSTYAADLLARLHQTAAPSSFVYVATARLIKVGLLSVAFVALAVALLRGAVWRTTGWSFIVLGSLTYPWYLVWTLPYAALRSDALVAFLVPLPLVAALMEPAFPHLGLGQLAMLFMLIAATYEVSTRRPLPAAIRATSPTL